MTETIVLGIACALGTAIGHGLLGKVLLNLNVYVCGVIGLAAYVIAIGGVWIIEAGVQRSWTVELSAVHMVLAMVFTTLVTCWRTVKEVDKREKAE